MVCAQRNLLILHSFLQVPLAVPYYYFDEGRPLDIASQRPLESLPPCVNTYGEDQMLAEPGEDHGTVLHEEMIIGSSLARISG